MIFEGSVRRRIYNNTNHIVYYVWKAVMLYIRSVYGEN